MADVCVLPGSSALVRLVGGGLTLRHGLLQARDFLKERRGFVRRLHDGLLAARVFAQIFYIGCGRSEFREVTFLFGESCRGGFEFARRGQVMFAIGLIDLGELGELVAESLDAPSMSLEGGELAFRALDGACAQLERVLGTQQFGFEGGTVHVDDLVDRRGETRWHV